MHYIINLPALSVRTLDLTATPPAQDSTPAPAVVRPRAPPTLPPTPPPESCSFRTVIVLVLPFSLSISPFLFHFLSLSLYLSLTLSLSLPLKEMSNYTSGLKLLNIIFIWKMQLKIIFVKNNFFLLKTIFIFTCSTIKIILSILDVFISGFFSQCLSVRRFFLSKCTTMLACRSVCHAHYLITIARNRFKKGYSVNLKNLFISSNFKFCCQGQLLNFENFKFIEKATYFQYFLQNILLPI